MKKQAKNNSNSNNKPGSQAAGSVSTTVVSEFVKIRKTISYLLHHNPLLRLSTNIWDYIFVDKISAPVLGKSAISL